MLMQLAVPPGNSTFREAMVMGSFLKIGHLSRGFDWSKLEVEHKNWDWNGWDVNGSEKQHWETTQSTGRACLIIIVPIKVVLHGDIPPFHTPIMESDSHDSVEQMDYKVLNETRDVSKTSGYLPKIVCPAKQDKRVGFVCQVSILENDELDQKPGTLLFTPKMACLNRDVHPPDFWKDNV